MSLIACTHDCLYQIDGYCSLERALSTGQTEYPDECINYIPNKNQLQNNSQGFPDVLDTN